MSIFAFEFYFGKENQIHILNLLFQLLKTTDDILGTQIVLSMTKCFYIKNFLKNTFKSTIM